MGRRQPWLHHGLHKSASCAVLQRAVAILASGSEIVVTMLIRLTFLDYTTIHFYAASPKLVLTLSSMVCDDVNILGLYRKTAYSVSKVI